KSEFELGKMNVGSYVLYLRSVSPAVWNQNLTPTMKSFAEAVSDELDLDFKKLSRERDDFLKMLSGKLDPQSLSRLADYSLKFRVGKISASQYYTMLSSLGDSQGVSLPQIV